MTTPAPFPSTALECEGWQSRVLPEVASTNSYAGQLPPWTAVRAVTQTAGRGRTPDRQWVSNEGGLWLSAVLPCPGARARWAVLPLAAGWAAMGALRELGVTEIRLRWPNDLMTGRRKLAGLLVERFTADTAVVGIGINVFNRPEAGCPELAGATARLADLVPTPITVHEVARLVLRHLRTAHALLANDDFRRIVDELNLSWSEPRRVAVTLTGNPQTFDGWFEGIDDQGRLRLRTAHNDAAVYDATDVTLLRELD